MDYEGFFKQCLDTPHAIATASSPISSGAARRFPRGFYHRIGYLSLRVFLEKSGVYVGRIVGVGVPLNAGYIGNCTSQCRHAKITAPARLHGPAFYASQGESRDVPLIAAVNLALAQKDDRLAQGKLPLRGLFQQACRARRGKVGLGVELSGSTPTRRVTAIGASRPLRRVPAIVSFLNPQMVYRGGLRHTSMMSAGPLSLTIAD